MGVKGESFAHLYNENHAIIAWFSLYNKTARESFPLLFVTPKIFRLWQDDDR